MGTLKQTVYVIVAFTVGVMVTYAIVRPPERWGVVVTTFGEGARLYGLFESKEECHRARTTFVDEYASMARHLGTVEKGPRSLLLDAAAQGKVNVTFTCLSLSEIRGLSLITDGGGHVPTR